MKRKPKQDKVIQAAKVTLQHHFDDQCNTDKVENEKKKLDYNIGDSLISAAATLERQSKDGDDAVHGLVFPTHGAGAVRVVVPIAGAGRVQAGSVLLHDDA